MFMKPIYLTNQDRHRLKDLINDCRAAPKEHASCIESLECEVKRAHTVDENALVSDVVTMNSKVRLRDMDSGENEVYTLVYPSMADPRENRLSVLRPLALRSSAVVSVT